MRKTNISKKGNTLNHNLNLIIENIKQNSQDIKMYDNTLVPADITEMYAAYLISLLEELKDKSKKYSGIVEQKGTEIIDTFNNKKYNSIREAERKTDLSYGEILKAIQKHKGITKAYKFEVIK